MKGTRHSEEQIIAILKQGEAGLTIRRGMQVERQQPTTARQKYRGGTFIPWRLADIQRRNDLAASPVAAGVFVHWD